MIRKNVLGCKLIRIKISASRLFQEQIKDFRPELETCPYCGGLRCCVRFASYERYVIDFIDGHPACEIVRVPRIRCRNCGHTHAILTDSLVPYRSYSLFFILRVIGEYLLHLWTVERLCTRFGITHSMLYRWVSLFHEHKAEWLGTLADLEQTPLVFLRSIVFLAEYSSFSEEVASKLAMTHELSLYLCPERRISFDGFVNYEGRRFGVPNWYTPKTCRVMRNGYTLYIYDSAMTKILTQHDVTWSRRDSFCEDQYVTTQPEEHPTAPIKVEIRQIASPERMSGFERFRFGGES